MNPIISNNAIALEEQIEVKRQEVDQLRREAQLPRKKASECMKDLMAYCEVRKADDFLVRDQTSGPGPKENPFQEKKKCTAL